VNGHATLGTDPGGGGFFSAVMVLAHVQGLPSAYRSVVVLDDWRRTPIKRDCHILGELADAARSVTSFDGVDPRRSLDSGTASHTAALRQRHSIRAPCHRRR
jgi:hypothetical protein